MPAHELKARLTLSIIGKADGQRKRDGEHHDSADHKKKKGGPPHSSAPTSLSIPSKKPTAPPKEKVDSSTWDQCQRCGGKHNPNSPAAQAAGWTCPFVKHKHPHHNVDPSTKWEHSTHAKLYKDRPWIHKDGQWMTSIPYNQQINAAGLYVPFEMNQNKAAQQSGKRKGRG